MSTDQLGRELRKAREVRSMSLKAVAEPAKITATTLHKLEAGQIQKPDPTMLSRLADVLDVSYTTLFGLAGYPMPGDVEGSASRPRRRRRAVPMGSLDRDILDSVTDKEADELVRYLSWIRERDSGT